MKRNTRQEILDAAKALFNQKGFNAVSIGDIAEALGISKGNLTYYFKRKEDILEALLAAMPRGTLLPPSQSLDDLHAFFKDIQEVIQENAFYFWHHTQFAQLFPEIEEKQKSIYQSNAEKFKASLGALHKKGFLREESYEGEYDRVVDTILLSAMYWIPFYELTKAAKKEADYPAQAWSIIFPLMTERGRSHWQAKTP